MIRAARIATSNKTKRKLICQEQEDKPLNLRGRELPWEVDRRLSEGDDRPWPRAYCEDGRRTRKRKQQKKIKKEKSRNKEMDKVRVSVKSDFQAIQAHPFRLVVGAPNLGPDVALQ